MRADTPRVNDKRIPALLEALTVEATDWLRAKNGQATHPEKSAWIAGATQALATIDTSNYTLSTAALTHLQELFGID